MGAPSSTASEPGYTVSYDSESHVQVLTQMWGSKWPEVLPFCLGNVAWMLVLTFLDDRFDHSLAMTTKGHTFIAVVVAFLLIERVKTGLDRYNEARAQLGIMNRAASQLVQYAFVFSADNTDEKAKEWRAELAYRALVLLRTTMAMIDYPTTGVPAWDVAELKGAERKLAREASTRHNEEARRRAHGEHSEAEESSRVPVRISYLLKQTVHSHKTRLEKPFAKPHYEMACMSELDKFLGGYYGIRKFLTTPVPFPFIQMSRTFLFAYVFTIPFALLSDASSLVAHCLVVFVFTYGFVGLELVAIEMDNPFGEDDNDFNNGALAEVAYEDIYMTVLDVDGPAWADRLRFKMHDSKSRHRLTNEQSWLLGDEA